MQHECKVVKRGKISNSSLRTRAILLSLIIYSSLLTPNCTRNMLFPILIVFLDLMRINLIFWYADDFFESKHIHVTEIPIQKLFNNIILHIFEFYLRVLFLSKFLLVLFFFFVVFLLPWIQFSLKICNSTRRVTKFISVSIGLFCCRAFYGRRLNPTAEFFDW